VFSKAVSSNVDMILKDFRQFFQLTMNDDLRRFDLMYSEDDTIADEEKMTLGLTLMEKGNTYRKIYKGQSITFKISNNNRLFVVYFPKPNDNISDGVYSYPRAAIHTARSLSNSMMQHKMVSALGLNVGWGSMIDEVNMNMFFDKMNTNNDALEGFDDVKKNPSIMYLVTIPKVRPHEFLNLSKAEALIFIIFSMMNDMIINLANNQLRMSNANAPLKNKFTTDTIKRLNKLSITFTNLDCYAEAIAFAKEVCKANFKRKGILPPSCAKFMKEMFEFCNKIMLNPDINDDNYTDITDLDLENVTSSSTNLQSTEKREPSTSSNEKN